MKKHQKYLAYLSIATALGCVSRYAGPMDIDYAFDDTYTVGEVQYSLNTIRKELNGRGQNITELLSADRVCSEITGNEFGVVKSGMGVALVPMWDLNNKYESCKYWLNEWKRENPNAGNNTIAFWK